MDLEKLKENWNEWGKKDPLWGVLTWSDKKNNKWEPEEFFKTGKNEIADLFKYLKLKNIQVQKGHALDFGCGVGRLTQALASEFTHVAGVDIAPSMISSANAYNTQGDACRYYLNEKDNLELFKDDSFDFIYSNIVLQHMEPRYSIKYIGEFIRVLKLGGIAIFQIPSEKKNFKSMKKSIGSRIRRKLRSIIRGSTKQSIQKEPVMEMYGIKMKEVVSVVTANGAKVLDIADDQSTKKWISYRYCIQKM